MQHVDSLISNLFQRDISIYKKQLCNMSKLFNMDVIPISGLLKPNTFELKVHPRAQYFTGQGEIAYDEFMQLLYGE